MSDDGSRNGGSRGESFVNDGGRSRSTCGYCKLSRPTSISHGLWADSLTVDDYQDLLDRGWRRCGTYLYQPEMETTCCPAYTIRLRANDFTPSKEQLRVSRRMQRYLDGIWDGKTQEVTGKSSNLQSCASVDESSSLSQVSTVKKTKEEGIMDYLSEQLHLATQHFVKRWIISRDIQFPKDFVKKVSQTKRNRFVEGSKDLLYTSNLSFQIAAIIRRTKSDVNDIGVPGSKIYSSDANGLPLDLSPKNIAEQLADSLQCLEKIPDLSVKACNGHINFYSSSKDTHPDKDYQSVDLSNESFNRYESKQHDMVSETPQRIKRVLEIHLKRSCFDPEEFALYRKYQVHVHDDEPNSVTESSYTNFLIDTPLIYVPPSGDNTVPSCGFGSFHQQYRIDGRLIAVGVIDILPKCVSSKYLFWDPDFAFLSLGKFSALQEIEWVKKNQLHCPGLEYYYLGYYIHSCSKMRYKAAYWPSELLCPLRYEWVPYDIAKPLLDRRQYVVLSDYTHNALNAQSSLTEEPPIKPNVLRGDDLDDGDSNDASVVEDVKMFDYDSGSSEDETYQITNDLTDLGNILLDLDGARLKYKDLQVDINPEFRGHFEKQLSRYLKVVGPKLSERIVYSVI